jgi:monoamine oxidase
VWGHIDRTATASYQLRPFGQAYIECYFGGACARELEAGGEQAFFAFAKDELVNLFGSDFARRIAPLQMHLWERDPFALGSYSYAVPGNAGARAVLAAPVEDRIFFAGEACSATEFSTAHGAYLTGIDAADQVLKATKR